MNPVFVGEEVTVMTTIEGANVLVPVPSLMNSVDTPLNVFP
jgi:hypothetical protein